MRFGKIQIYGIRCIALEAHDRVRGVLQLRSLTEPVRTVYLDAVIRKRCRQDSIVPVALAQHPAHVIRQRLVTEHVVGRVVPEVDRAEARAEATGAEVQLVEHPHVEVGHVELEPVASVAGFHVRRDVVGDVDRYLESRLDGEAIERAVRPSVCVRARLGGDEVVVQLRRAREVVLHRPCRSFGEVREQRCQDQQRRQQPWVHQRLLAPGTASACIPAGTGLPFLRRSPTEK